MKQRKIAVIGASLVGPSVANLLRSKGFKDVTVYEALRRPHSQSGGIMGLRYPTIDVLARIGIRAESIRATTSELVVGNDMTGPGTYVHRGDSVHTGVTTSWDMLYRMLNGRTNVQFGQRLVKIEPDGACYALTFRSGHTDTADVVIFADGRKSFGRDALTRNALRYNGYVTWRGLATPPNVRMNGGFTRFYDTEAGRLFGVTGPLIQNGRSYWELSHNLRAAEWSRIANGSPTQHAYMLPSQVHADARAIVERYTDRLPGMYREMIRESEIAGIPVNDVSMPQQLVYRTDGGAVAVTLGDAAIPVRLQVGAGLNQGLVQAGEMVDALSEGDTDALSKWERHALDRLGPYVELGRSRAHRINLGTYVPVRPGSTSANIDGDVWGQPKWVTA